MIAGLPLQARIAGARLHRRLGAAGWIGLALWLVALASGGIAWEAHRKDLRVSSEKAVVPAAAPVAAESPVEESPPIVLAEAGEWPLLLTQIQQTVVGQGLAWAAADYKSIGATVRSLASVEVRCRLKGTYPQLRSVLGELLRRVPGLTIRDFAMSRASAEVAEVEARLTLAVFLRGASLAPEEAASAVAMREVAAP